MPRPYKFVVVSVTAGAVLLSLNNPTPCYNDTVDLICYYPDVMGRYTVIAASWRVNGELIFPDGNVFDQQTVNQTVSTLRVRVDPANFTGDPVNFTCYLPLTGGGEDNASTMVDPQGMAILKYTHCIGTSKIVITPAETCRCMSTKRCDYKLIKFNTVINRTGTNSSNPINCLLLPCSCSEKGRHQIM